MPAGVLAHERVTDTFESTIHEGHGAAIYDREQEPATYVDDTVELSDNGEGTITMEGLTLPVIDAPPVAGGPMGCDGDTMSLGFTSGLADTAAVSLGLTEPRTGHRSGNVSASFRLDSTTCVRDEFERSGVRYPVTTA